MPFTRTHRGLALTTVIQIIVENPANSGEMRTFELVWLSIDSANDAFLPITRRRFENNTARQVLPTNCLVAKSDSVSRLLVLAPGEWIEGNASADGDVVVDVQQTFAEPV